MWFGWGFMMFGPLCLVSIGVAIYYVVTSTSHREKYSQHSHYQHSQYVGGKALEVLKERYAKGEITKEKYYEMKKDIES